MRPFIARLSRSEKIEDRKRLVEMRDEGIDISIGDETEILASALSMSIIGGPESFIFNLASGLAGYAIRVHLVASRSGLTLMRTEVATTFDDQIELESFDLVGRECNLGQCRYQKCEVLNDRFPLKLVHGSVVEAVILATGLKPIPQGVLAVPFKLTFWDQFSNEVGIEEKLTVDRSTTPRQKLGRPSKSLFEPEGFSTGESETVHEPEPDAAANKLSL